jgi:hypothetical protein
MKVMEVMKVVDYRLRATGYSQRLCRRLSPLAKLTPFRTVRPYRSIFATDAEYDPDAC